MKKKILIFIAIFVLALSALVISAENPSDTDVVVVSGEDPGMFQTFLNIVIDKLIAIKGEMVNIRASLYFQNGSPVQGQTVGFYIDSEKIDESITDDSGLAMVDWDTSSVEPGVYLIGVDFPGAEGLIESHAEGGILVEGEGETGSYEDSPSPEDTSVSTQSTSISDRVSVIEDCEDHTVEKTEIIKGICSDDIPVLVCDDEPANTSCHTDHVTNERDCVKGMKTSTVTEKRCETKGYVIDNKIKIIVKDYGCSFSEEKEGIVVICDSRYDGNGNGICTSGESCVKYIINGQTYQRLEKNSRRDFVVSDDSFFKEKPSEEVLG